MSYTELWRKDDVPKSMIRMAERDGLFRFLDGDTLLNKSVETDMFLFRMSCRTDTGAAWRAVVTFVSG
jgi:hypothetical protein